MRWLKLRIFVTAWAMFSLFFATNIVREHYPAFALVDHASFRVDEYEGFHSDIFRHTDGHCYIGNQVLGSVIAAVPLLIFDPLLDRLEDMRRGGEGSHEATPARYDTEYPGRAVFYKKVRDRGLDLRFGGAAVVTSVFLMAPLSALFCVVFFSLLTARGVRNNRAAFLALLFGFGTPVLYRTAFLNHNVFLMQATFAAFLAAWPKHDEAVPLSWMRRLGAGFFGGLALALDYAGVIPLIAVFVYLIVTQRRALPWKRAIVAAWPYVLGAVPPVAFLLFSQWAMYGDPFRPGQYWMRDVNYTDRGWRGIDWPSASLFSANLFSPDFGLVPFGPILALAVWPVMSYPRDRLFLPARERWFVLAFTGAFLTFCAANQYSWMQWNTGFRYLLPLVPFLFLCACDHLVRLRTRSLIALSVPVLAHSIILAMVRYTPPDRLTRPGDPSAIAGTYERFFSDGPDFPWLKVLRSTSSIDLGVLHARWLPWALMASAGVFCWLVWRPRDTSARKPSPA